MSTPSVAGRYKKLLLLAVLCLLFTQVTPQSIDASVSALAQGTCGAWSVVPTAGTAVESWRLKGVAATSATNVWAIGTTGGTSDLIARWDGTKWANEPRPQPGSLFNDYAGIAASPEGDAWIVGSYSSSNVSRPSMAEISTLTQRLQGGRWKLIPSPNLPTKGQSYLNSVAPIGPDDVWAVGHAGGQDILMYWNGTEWSIVPGPDTAFGGYLFDVAGTAANDVWAVGVHTTNRLTQAARILHWDGTRWERVASPEVASDEYDLQGVAALSVSDAWAVGTRRENGKTLTLVEHWDGSSWKVVPSPNTSQPENALHRVAALAPDDVWAVGRAGIGGDAQPLMMHWNGVTWSTVTLPRTNAQFADLVAVAVVSGTGEVWAVGAYAGRDGKEYALAMRYMPCTDGNTPGTTIPGMPSTGAEGRQPLATPHISSVLYEAIVASKAMLRHS